MTAEAYPREDSSPSIAAGLNLLNHTVSYITKMFGYSLVFSAYVIVFVVSIATLGLIEIRQANLTNSNALIAMLEQQEHYLTGKYFDHVLAGLDKDISQYKTLASLSCSDQADAVSAGQSGLIGAVGKIPNTDPTVQSAEPLFCAEIKARTNQHLLGLISLQDNLMFHRAKLPIYYDEYTDGLRDKTPQLIPLLRYMNSSTSVVTEWARLPFELLEMLLLVCMGALGGVIGVTRCFVDRSTPNPTARDLCYRPVAGAVIALGIYVLFRATQLFFGGGSQDNAITASTSVFLLGALGLASGFCAREAVSQIERVATRLLRGSQGDQAGNKSATDSPGPTTAAAGDANPAGLAP